ncbi:carboxypeptidase S [Lentinus tigrinus ALCF2SS1-7]|uniref:Carboxypeptidase S n=1 Tax=Lentinus tigrinus ALCF2SS1-6 TaxID=1328759 RepID=A0A5C2SKJ7_9APHY|nr:carboxypeptidase S [Lentinus tigrinus ALCF2SS1-6]RPD76585.1 carboxypeptidase S [Lentinus tigrinus ALCF2SS1-7]
MQHQGRLGNLTREKPTDFCPQTEPLNPKAHADLERRLALDFQDSGYKHKAYDALSGAIQVPTESYDDLGPVGEDERWETFGQLHEYLEKTFPNVFEKLQVTKVNTYGIVLRWKGSDESLRPVLMTAHQDVVPVEPATVDQWIHPPYSGHFDGEWIWGRGSCDDKSDLVASLHAIDALLKHGFEPKRTFVWAYGFDEEAAGTEGAGHLATYLEQQYGTHGFELMLDEGGSYGTPYGDDVVFAVPALSEKGYLDIRIEVSTKGGHSSVPPKHTAIGILSSMIVAVEENPHEPELVRGGSPYNSTMCAAVFGPSYPSHIRKLALKAGYGDDEALHDLRDALLETFPRFEAILRTTQAVDLVQGGVKVNALPEKVSAVVNHRIAEHSSVRELQKHMTDTILPIAKKYDLSVDAFGVSVSAGSGQGGRVALSDAWGTALEPSPVTPTGKDDPYQILAGTIKATIESSEGYNAKGIVVAPLLAIGNTDTRYYWNVTKNIFRYHHLHENDRYNGAHTVNEAVRAEGWIESIRFYTKFVLNVDENL